MKQLLSLVLLLSVSCEPSAPDNNSKPTMTGYPVVDKSEFLGAQSTVAILDIHKSNLFL